MATTNIPPHAPGLANEPALEWSTMPLALLIEKLVGDHKRWREDVLPALAKLLGQRARLERLEPVTALRHVFARMCQELEEHLKEEETVLFPAILEMDRRTGQTPPLARPSFGSVRNPIVMIQRDHEDDAMLWDTLQHLALLDATAKDASEPVRRLYQDLTLFADDVKTHTAIESTILFPRAVELEKQLVGQVAGLRATP